MLDCKLQIERILKRLDSSFASTKDEYMELFLKELEKEKLYNEDKDWIEKYTDLLNPNVKSLFEYNINTKEEFIQRLIMFLNVSNNSSNDPLFLVETNALLNTLLKSITEIASEQLKNDRPDLFSQKNLQSSEGIKELLKAWSDLNYNQGHLKIQKQMANIIAKLAESCMVDFNPEVKELVATLNNTPQSITDINVLKALEEVSEYNDKDSKLLRRNGQKISYNTNEILREIESAIQSNNNRIQEILKIRNSITEEKDDIEEEKKVIVEVIDVLHSKMIEVNNTLKNKESNIRLLYEELNSLSLYIKNIEEQSKLDDLTNVYNRKYVDNIAEVCEKQYQSNTINYAILFFDIDNFKNINDAYGHTAGDKLLSVFSKILKKNCRGTDIVGRYGGDEFLILMPNTDLEKAKEFAKRICQTIASTNFIYKNQKIKITTSIGITDRSSHQDKFDMIDSADKFLYKAKHTGRNRVEWQ